ncbi:MAG: ribosome biogenesis GTPase Der [Syntrophales bacterium]|nr:ribosome biogenesis GTPase Der [Syntrophales bacterium]
MSTSFHGKRETENGKPVVPQALPLVAIIGRANVGKSTLLNRLTRSAQALVADFPGVTRDRLYGRVDWQDHAFLLVDTGGLVGGEEALGELVRRQAEAAVAEADVLLLVMDGKEGPQAGDAEVIDYLRRTGKSFLLAVNKIDHPGREEILPEFYRFGVDPLFPVAAAHGLGIGALLTALVLLLPRPGEAAEAAPGIRVAILGRPNVGKSSLVNRFLGEERLMVSPLPGTTRDVVDITIHWQEQDYVLVDTAGLRRPSLVAAGLERQMVLKAIKALSRAEVALLLLDAQEGVTQQDLRIASLINDQGKGCLILVNKWDLVQGGPQQAKKILERVAADLEFMAYVPVLPVSVKTGHNLPKIFPLVNTIDSQSRHRAPTRELNLLLKEITERVPPSRYRDRPVKFYYLTQAEVQPPTFIAFVNQPAGVKDSYRRYLLKQLRERLGLTYAPLRLYLKGRQRRK